MVSTYRKEARNKRKQFPLDTKSLSTSGNKVSPKNRSFISVTASNSRKKINKRKGFPRKGFPQNRKSVSTIQNEKLV